MKKTLVALAALAATSAFAQTSVVIDGYFDRGYTVTNNTNNASDSKAVASSAGTTTIGFKVREDLGNGLSVGGSVNTDWNDLGGNKQSDVTGTGTQRGGFANSQSFLDVTSSKYGTLRLGTPNSFTLTNATAVAAPAFSTAIGSSYSSSFSIANGFGTGTSDKGGIVDASSVANGAAHAGQRSIRIANSVQYSSPAVLGGLTAHVAYTPKNDADTTNVNLTAGTSKNTVGVSEYALRYTNGPVDAMFTSIKYSVGENNINVGGNVTATNTNQSSKTSTQNLLGATYAVLPALKLHAGLGQFKSSDDSFKGKSKQIGATYTLGQWEVLGQVAKVTDQVATNAYDRSLKGMGVNYNFSKTARAYFRADRINYATSTNAVATGFAGDAQTRYALGVSKSF